RVREGRAACGTSIAQEDPTGLFDLEDIPLAVRPVAVGSGHVVLAATARRQFVLGECGWVGWRPPPTLQLARIGPELPNALDRCVEFGLDGQGEPSGILANSGNGQRPVSFGSTISMGPALSAISSSMRSIRPRHKSSY